MTSLKKNFFYNAIFQVVNIIVPLITAPYIARVLKPKGVGDYSFAYTVGYYFVTLAMLGVYNYGNRSIAKVRDSKGERDRLFWEIYSMQIASSLVMVLAYFVYIIFFTNDKMAWMLIPYVISPVFDVNWFFFGIERFKLTAIRSLLIKVISAVLIFVLIKDDGDVYIYGLIMAGSFFVAQISLWPALLKDVSIVKPDMGGILRHIKPNLTLFIPIIAITLYKMMDKIMLGVLINKTQVGYYESAEKIIQIPLAMITALGTVMLPRMSNLVAKNDNKKGFTYIKLSLVVAAFISSSLCFGIMGVSKEFVPLFFGKGYETCIGLLLILMPSCMVMAYANVIRTQFLIPNEMDKVYILSVFGGAICNLGLNVLLIPRMQSIGAAIGTLCAECFVAFYQMMAVRDKMPIFSWLLYTIPFLLTGIVMFVILYSLNIGTSGVLALAYKIILGVCIYVILIGVIILIMKKHFLQFIDGYNK